MGVFQFADLIFDCSGAARLACAPGDHPSPEAIDYARLLPILNFTGVYLIEYEPLEVTVDGLRRSLTHLRRAVPSATLEG